MLYLLLSILFFISTSYCAHQGDKIRPAGGPAVSYVAASESHEMDSDKEDNDSPLKITEAQKEELRLALQKTKESASKKHKNHLKKQKMTDRQLPEADCAMIRLNLQPKVNESGAAAAAASTQSTSLAINRKIVK